MNEYKLTIENISLIDGMDVEVIFETVVKTKKSILNFLSSSGNVANLFKIQNIEISKVLGTIIEIQDDIDEPYVTIGHEGDDSGNIKTIRQLYISWK